MFGHIDLLDDVKRSSSRCFVVYREECFLENGYLVDLANNANRQWLPWLRTVPWICNPS
jgi:hypothetical protein